MSFIVYDKEGKEHKIDHAIDVKNHIAGGYFTVEKPVIEAPEVKKPKKAYGKSKVDE